MTDVHDIVTGIHHMTSCVGGAQEDIDFMTQVIGQRMIKQTVLFDGERPIYHLYYANRDAEIGTVMTTFPFRQAGVKGRRGSGQVCATAYSVPEDSMDFWINHLDRHEVEHSGIHQRFGQDVLTFAEPSGNVYELVGDDRDSRNGWTTDLIPEKHAVKGFNSVLMSVRDVRGQHDYFTEALGFEKVDEAEHLHKYHIQDGGPCKTVILRHDPDLEQGSWTFGEGTVHHIAFQVANDEEQAKLKEHIVGLGYTDVSESKDRNYFHSVYVRSPGGPLTEFATCDIGFTVDEKLEELGQHLLLPPWLEDRREEIIAPLEDITVPEANRLD